MNLLRLFWSFLREPAEWLSLLSNFQEEADEEPENFEPLIKPHRTMWSK